MEKVYELIVIDSIYGEVSGGTFDTKADAVAEIGVERAERVYCKQLPASYDIREIELPPVRWAGHSPIHKVDGTIR